MNGYPDDNPKTVLGLTKPSIASVPPIALFKIGAAMADGARKYGRFNYREHAITASTYYDAVMRHLLAWWDGEDVAADSGVDHLAHAAACLCIAMDARSLGKLNDDRKLPGGLPGYLVDNTTKAKVPPTPSASESGFKEFRL